MQIPLRRAQILVARQFLCDDRISCVLGGPRAELVAQRVPDEALVATPLQPRELEQFPPHGAEIALTTPAGGKLGVEVSQAGVAKYMIRRRQPPSQMRRSFLRDHIGSRSW